MNMLIVICLAYISADWTMLDTRVSNLERRIAGIEDRLAKLETPASAAGQRADDCRCDRCDCDPCLCVDARIAVGKPSITVLTPSFHCSACDQAKEWLRSQGKAFATRVDDTLSHWPQFEICESGQCQRVASQAELRAIVAPQLYRAPSATTASYSTQAVQYMTPITTVRRGLFGRRIFTGNCASCR